MAEIIDFRYSAATDAIVVELDVVENGAVVVGKSAPRVRMTLADLARRDPIAASSLKGLLARLEPVLRTASAAIANDPAALVAKAAAQASKDEELAAREARLVAMEKAAAMENAAKTT